VSIRAVIDTSALIGPARHQLVFLASQGYYTIVWSPFLISEVTRIRTELAIKHGQERAAYRDRINRLVDAITGLADVVDHTRLEDGNYTDWLRDSDDAPVLATALVGGAQWIVSHNTKHFPPSGSFAGIRFTTPDVFLDWLYAQHPERDLPQEFDDAGYRVP
jgi:predicted nucleic acid-binding protein